MVGNVIFCVGMLFFSCCAYVIYSHIIIQNVTMLQCEISVFFISALPNGRRKYNIYILYLYILYYYIYYIQLCIIYYSLLLCIVAVFFRLQKSHCNIVTFGIPSLALPLSGWCPYAVEGGRCLSHLMVLFLTGQQQGACVCMRMAGTLAV